MTRRDPAGGLDQISLSSPQQRVFRAAALGSTVLFVVVLRVAAGEPHPLLSALAVVLGVVAALLPESDAVLGLVVYLGGLWLVAVPGRLDLWVLVAALLICVLHVSCTLASYGPPGLTLDARLLRLWRVRALMCLATAVLVWGAARLLSSLHRPPSALALALGLLLVVTWGVVVRMRLAGAVPGEDG